MAVISGWMQLQAWLYPAPPNGKPGATASAPAGSEAPSAGMAAGASQPAGVGGVSGAPGAGTPSPATAGYGVVAGASSEPVQLGIDAPRAGDVANPYFVSMKLDPRGAAADMVDLTDHRNSVPTSRRPPPDTYDLLSPIKDLSTNAAYHSFVTRSIRFVTKPAESKDAKADANQEVVNLADVPWSVTSAADQKGQTYRFETTVTRAGTPIMTIAKSYRLEHDSRMLRVEFTLTNLADTPQGVILTQGGPLGMRVESLNYEDRNAYVCIEGRSVKPHTRPEVWGKEDHKFEFDHDPDNQKRIIWAATANRYFCAIMAPRSLNGVEKPDFVKKVALRTVLDTEDKHAGDVTLDWYIGPPKPIEPKGVFACAFDVYLGPRTPAFMPSDPAIASLGFDKMYAADRSPCTFEWLSQLMIKLFNLLHKVLPGKHNFAIAIIVFVLIVRTILHPLTKKSQINMARMQKGMATMQPKLEALKQKFGSDKAGLNAATMQLYSSEGINPVGNMMSCLPMFLQMPVWVALWSTLNTAIELRHEPVIPGLPWMRDLSAPDSLFSFGGATFHIPLLGSLTGPIVGLNVLPFIMALTMYLQQKYTQKLTRPDTPPPPSTPSPDGKPSPADQLAMQQKMMNFMVVFMALMFYNFPSGLNLYILTSNLFGMVEQHRIRKHIKAKESAGALAPKRIEAPPGMPGWLQRLQKMAEDARQIRGDDKRR